MTFLIKKYTRFLLNSAKKLGRSDEMADEVIQSTWKAFFETVERFEGRSSLKTYLYGIFYNKLRETWRSEARYIDTDADQALDRTISDQFASDGRWVTGPLSPDKLVWINQARNAIQQCMDKLGDKYKMALHLKEVEGEDTAFICKALGISSTNLGVILFRAKHMMRKCLESKSISGRTDEV